MPSENDRKKLQRLKKIRQDAKAELLQRIAAARKELSAKILAGADNPKVVTSTAFRETFYSRVSGQYEAMGIELDQWLRDLVKTTGGAFRKETVLAIATKTGAAVDSSVVKFDRKLTEDYWKLINPDNAKSLTAVFTENMNKTELDMLRTSFVETQRQAKLSGWTAREQHKALQAAWDVQAGNAASDRFVDAAGRKWTNARYMDMLIQTTTARIGRESAFDAQIDATGSELVKIVNTGESCPICAAWDGVVLSITGKNKNHPSYNSALRAGMFHPLCDCLTEAMDETLDADLVKKQAGTKNPDIKPKSGEKEADFKKRATTAVAAYRSEADGGAPAPASVASVENDEPAQKPAPPPPPPPPKPTKASVEAHAQQLGFTNTKFGSIPPVESEKILAHLETLKSEYAWSYTRMHDERGKGVFASSSTTSLGVSKKRFSNRAELTKRLNELSEQGFLHKDATPESVITHEYGHHMTSGDIKAGTQFGLELRGVHSDYVKAREDVLAKHKLPPFWSFEHLRVEASGSGPAAASAKAAWDELEPIFISDYASTNAKEFVAESFASYRHSKKPSPFAVRVGTIVRGEKGKKP